MKRLNRWVKKRFHNVMRRSSHHDRVSEYRLFGLGQFVLLITIAPFIFDLSLYSLEKPSEVPSHYEYNPERFTPLPLTLSATQQRIKPIRPARPRLNTNDRKELNKCKRYPLHQFFYAKHCNQLRNNKAQYQRTFNNNFNAFLKRARAYNKKNAGLQARRNTIHRQYLDFNIDQDKA